MRFTFVGQMITLFTSVSPFEIGHCEREAVARVSAEVVAARGDGERAALHADRVHAGVHVTSWRKSMSHVKALAGSVAAIDIGPIAAVGDDIARDEKTTVLRRRGSWRRAACRR